MPSHTQEQEQVQDEDLSALFTPPVATATTFEIISPTPRAHMEALPPISDSEIDLSVHASPVPPSGSSPARAPPRQQASLAVLGQAQNQSTFGNQSSLTAHQTNIKWQHSMLRHPEQINLPVGAAGIGGSAIQAGGQIPQRSCTPRAHSGSEGVRSDSALGLNEPPATPSNPEPVSALRTKPPTPTPQIKQTTTNLLDLKSSNAEPGSTTPASAPAPAPALPSKTPTPALSRTHTPIPPSKTSTPKPKSRCTSPGLTSTSVRNPTDYDPAIPIRPMPGLKSPSTEPDPIFPSAGACDESATRRFNPLDTSGVDIDDDPPPPFKEFESPVHPRGANFGAGVNDRKGPGKQIAEGSRGEGADGGAGKEELQEIAIGEGAIIGENIGDVDDVGGQKADGGTIKNAETSQDAGDHARSADSANREDGAPENRQDKEQEKSEHGEEGNEGAVNDSQATREDVNFASGDTQVAGDEAQDIDSTLKPEPTPLTPVQKEAETHRNAFLLKEVARLEELRALNSSDKQGPSEIQARLSAVKARILRTIFADPPRCSPPVPEVSSSGKNPQELTSELTNTIVDLLLERQDAKPINVIVSSPTKKRQTAVEKTLKEFIVENNFSMRSGSVQFSTEIIV